jgi:hypothetical protein
MALNAQKHETPLDISLGFSKENFVRIHATFGQDVYG